MKKLALLAAAAVVAVAFTACGGNKENNTEENAGDAASENGAAIEEVAPVSVENATNGVADTAVMADTTAAQNVQ